MEIGTSALDGSDYRRLTNSDALDTNPVWSHDGARIAFVSGTVDPIEDPNANDWGIYTMAADGSDVRMVSPASLVVTRNPPVWSPDGRRIAFLADEGNAKGLYIVAADGADPTRIAATLAQPAWSPDGTRIAFAIAGRYYSARSDGSDVEVLTYPNRTTFQAYEGLSWSPDGSEIRFVGPRYYPLWVDFKNVVNGVHAIKVDGSGARTIADLNGRQTPIGWSPDGSRIAVRDDVHKPAYRDVVLYTLAANGSDPRPLAWRQDRQYVNGYEEERPVLSPPPTPTVPGAKP